MEIAIIVLSLLCAYFGYELMKKSYRLGQYDKEREAGVIPEINHYKDECKRLRRDIGKIIEGDEYVADLWKETLDRDKTNEKMWRENLIKSFK